LAETLRTDDVLVSQLVVARHMAEQELGSQAKRTNKVVAPQNDLTALNLDNQPTGILAIPRPGSVLSARFQRSEPVRWRGPSELAAPRRIRSEAIVQVTQVSTQ
jgi:hypothetical protein